MFGRLLVFDCHEAWVYQLRALPQQMDVVVGLRGRHTDRWDESMRPKPPNARIVRLDEVLGRGNHYDCIIAHNITDLLDAKTLVGPRLLVLHETLHGATLEQGSVTPPAEIKRALERFVRLTHTHVVAVSCLKGRSWGFEDDIVTLSADPSDYRPWKGDLVRGLRVANHIERRPRILLWEFHRRAFEGLPVTLVGHNPSMEGVRPSKDWADLRETLSRHRFYIHTADPQLEDGYNMATLEAMAAGLPVLGNRHPTSPIEHGVNGFMSDDPLELRGYAEQLLGDHELAQSMGQAARETIRKRFFIERFARDFGRSIELARRESQRSVPHEEPILACEDAGS